MSACKTCCVHFLLLITEAIVISCSIWFFMNFSFAYHRGCGYFGALYGSEWSSFLGVFFGPEALLLMTETVVVLVPIKLLYPRTKVGDT